MILGRNNWVADRNPHSMPEPPEWWLDALWTQDDRLVVFPSRTEASYLLARRRLLTPGLGPLAIEDPERDTAMAVSYDCIPIDHFNTNGSWDRRLFAELQARDTWAFARTDATAEERGDAAADHLEAQEDAADVAERKAFRDDMDRRARAALFHYRSRTGATSKRASDYHGHARPAALPESTL